MKELLEEVARVAPEEMQLKFIEDMGCCGIYQLSTLSPSKLIVFSRNSDIENAEGIMVLLGAIEKKGCNWSITKSEHGYSFFDGRMRSLYYPTITEAVLKAFIEVHK